MEILQTIWTALTTENEALSNILIYCLSFLEATLTMLLFTNFLNISATFKQKLGYIICFSLVSIFSGVFLPTPYNTFINAVACPVFVLIFFKTKILTAILAEIIPYLFFVLVGSIVHKLYIAILNIPTDSLLAIPIYRVTSSLCIYLTIYIIYVIKKHFKIHTDFLTTLKTNRTFIINFLIGVLAISVQSYIAFIYSDSLPAAVILLNIATLLFYFVFSLYSLVRTNKLEIAERDLEQSKQYIKTLTILHDNIRCFKHDFGNMVTTIGRLCAIK